jgi:hypothetical protein
MRTSLQQPLPPMEVKRVESPVSTALKSVESFRPLIARAFGHVGLSQKRAALEMGIPESQLSRQLAGTEHLSLWRMHGLSREFWREFVLLIIDFYDLQIGLCEQDRRDLENGRALRLLVERSVAR